MHYPSVCALVILFALNVNATLVLVVVVFDKYPSYEFPLDKVQVNSKNHTGTFEIGNLSSVYLNMLSKIQLDEPISIGVGNAINNSTEIEVKYYLKFNISSSFNSPEKLDSTRHRFKFTFNMTEVNENLAAASNQRGAFLTADKQDIIALNNNDEGTVAPGNIDLLPPNGTPQPYNPNGLIFQCQMDDTPQIFRIYTLPSTMSPSPLLCNRIDYIKASEIDKVQELRSKTRKFFDGLRAGQQNGNQGFTYQGILIDDYFFLRFLRGKRGNIKKASKLVKECVKFKTTDGAYKIILEKQTSILSFLDIISIFRYEKPENVREIFFIDLSKFNLAEALKQNSADDILKFVYSYVKGFEDILQILRTEGRTSKIILIVNLQNFKFNFADVFTCGIQGKKVISGVITAFAKYSPEVFEEIFLVNSAESSIPGIGILAKSCSNKSTRNITYVRDWSTRLNMYVEDVKELPMNSGEESVHWKRYPKA